MPGIVNMEQGGQHGARSDHDRGAKLSDANGINGSHSVEGSADSATIDKGKGHFASRTESDAGKMVNGAGAQQSASQDQTSQTLHYPDETSTRMNDLPDEIVHITQGFIPLSLLLIRLAQTTHNTLQEKIAELAKMPLPASTTNGNTNHTPSAPDDTSADNLRKKSVLLNAVQDMHAKWVKALVILEWSRKSQMVSKLIDLKFNIDQQRILFDIALDNLVNVKRDLTYARMPSPDLKTALQILSTGTAPWMPDLQYIEPPPLTPQDQLKWMKELNTLLSLRLNLDDYDRIPYHFKKYTIASGRVTFKVPGEFEVDLTIADEDFEKQFWFIDFRYAFQPAALSLPDSLMTYLEGCVNNVLGKDGLVGCYQFLHEFVLTSKINELKRQANQLSKSAWAGTLTVEPLNRALAIQYWTSRSSVTGTKSWVLVAVTSGRKTGGQAGSKSQSHLVAKWYRDNKEMKDVAINLDYETLSAESLIKTVVGKHIEYILSGIRDKLLAAPRFKTREAGMVLRTSTINPGASSLVTQVGYDKTSTLLIEPTTGVFAMKPPSKFTIQHEHQLNSGKSPIDDGVKCLENVRCGMMEDEIHRRGSSMGWSTRKSAMSPEELRPVTKIRDWSRILWLQKHGWGANWFVVVFLGLSGDEWWLLETNRTETAHSIRFQSRLPLNKGHPDLSDLFWNNLALFSTGMIAQAVDMRELHRHRIKSRSNGSMNLSLSQQVRLPSVEVALAAIFPAMVFDKAARGTTDGLSPPDSANNVENIDLLPLMQGKVGSQPPQKQPWANNIVTIKFDGVQATTDSSDGGSGSQVLTCVSDAVIRVERPSKFAALKAMGDGDISYDPQRGEFSTRMKHRLGEPLFATLKSRIKAVDRFVNFLESMDKIKGVVISESMSLKEVAFRYGEEAEGDNSAEQSEALAARKWRVVLDLSREDIDIIIEKGNPHLLVVDLMRQLANSDGGIGALMAWLPASLPALKAIDEMETRWEELQHIGKGRLAFSMKTIAWISLRYTIIGSGANSNASSQLCLEVKVRARRGEAWWHISRPDAEQPDTQGDEFAKALKPIWDGKGDGWLGLMTSAAGRPNGGVTKMLLAVDEAIRTAMPAIAASVPPASSSKSTKEPTGTSAGAASKQGQNSTKTAASPKKAAAAKINNAKGSTGAKAGNAKPKGKAGAGGGGGVVVLD